MLSVYLSVFVSFSLCLSRLLHRNIVSAGGRHTGATIRVNLPGGGCGSDGQSCAAYYVTSRAVQVVK